MRIDLNADLGEGSPQDRALLQLVSSANIACGFHAGDPQTMRQSVRWAMEFGVAIGAHPGYPDKENFGRSAVEYPPETVWSQVLYQLGALSAITRAEGGKMTHVKPHGMLYNQAARDPQLADVIAHAVKTLDAGLILVGLAGSALIQAAERHGLACRQEVFADRRYLSDGSLVPRSEDDAVIHDPVEALRQTMMMIEQGVVQSREGRIIPVRADTVCLHGDNDDALAFATLLRQQCFQRKIDVSARQ